MSLASAIFARTVAGRLQSLESADRRRARSQRRSKVALAKRVEELEQDLGYVTLVLTSLVGELDKKGVVTRETMRETLSELDGIDGVRDGRLDIAALKEIEAE